MLNFFFYFFLVQKRKLNVKLISCIVSNTKHTYVVYILQTLLFFFVCLNLQKYRQKLKSSSYGKNNEANIVASGSDTSHSRIDTPPSVNIHGLATLDLNISLN